MFLLDIFKKKKTAEKKPFSAKVTEGKEVKKEKKPVSAKAAGEKGKKTAEKKEEYIKVEPAIKKRTSGEAYRILYSPHVTEKATSLTEEDKYTFKVWPRANKNEIKKSVEEVYGVKVVGVKIINIPKKERRTRGQTGWKKGYKKAIVQIKKGQKIEILPR
jgi:large subunit ribosomal protein L23